MRPLFRHSFFGLTLTALGCTSSGEPSGPAHLANTGGEFESDQGAIAGTGDTAGAVGNNGGGTVGSGGVVGNSGASGSAGTTGFASGGLSGGNTWVTGSSTSGDEGWNPAPSFPPTLPFEPIVASRPPPPISGGTLAVSSDGAIAVAADSDRDKVYVVDLSAATSQTISLARGAEPGRVAFDAEGRAHVVLRGVGQLLQVDPVRAVAIRQTKICDHPRGIAYRATSDAVLVACADGDLVTLSAANHNERTRTFVELDLRDVLVTKDERTFVSTFRAAQLIEVDALGKELDRRAPSAYAVNRIDAGPTGAGDHRQVTLRPRVAWRATLDAAGSPLMLHQRSQIDEVRTGRNGYSRPGPCSSVTEFSVSTPMAEGATGPGVTLASAVTAVDIASSPNGRWVAIASAGSSLQGRESLHVHSAVGLTDSQSSSGGCREPAARKVSAAQATAVSFDASGRLLVQSREPAQLEIFTIVEPTVDDTDAGAPIASVYLTPDTVIHFNMESVRDAGHELLHGDAGSGLACASCHPEGRDDGHIWTFRGIGARRTQNFRGGVKATAPFHWAGDLPTFASLVDETMTNRMGGFFVPSNYANALLDWLNELPAVKLAAREPSAAARGKTLFESNQCATCHSGANLTNNATVDVGTGSALQVPSLLGLGLRGPYMHNGCAKDLSARFDASCGGDDRHGNPSKLSEAQIADLVAYLSTL